MEEFKKYYKFPLKHDSEYRIKIMTDDYGMALDWLVDIANHLKEALLNALNGKQDGWSPSGKFTLYKGYIYYNNKKILCVRGWGRLTGVGGYNLPQEKAVEIQDAFAEYCVKALNKNNE